MREEAVTFTFCVALGSMAALAGCGSGSPAPAPSTVTVPRSPVLVQLSGVATDDDSAPLSGVAVFVTPFLNPHRERGHNGHGRKRQEQHHIQLPVNAGRGLTRS